MIKKSGRIIKQWPLYVMMLFPALLLVIYSYGPMFGLVMVFQRFEPAKGFFRSAWIGFDNFRRVFATPDIWQITFNSFFIAVMKIVLGTFTAIITAILLNEITGTFFKRTVQTIIYAPYFLSWVILGGVFRELLAMDGLINMGLEFLNKTPVNFLATPELFPGVLITTELWQMTGFNAIIYLAAIIGIDPALYEAAAIDGAGRFKQVIKILIPGIMSYIILMAVLNIGYILNAGFEQILMLYSPSVYSTGDVIDTWVYRAGLKNTQYSLAAAVGLLRSLVSFVLITFSYWLARKKWNYNIF
jgi:putative aldouronate transport system permease protein